MSNTKKRVVLVGTDEDSARLLNAVLSAAGFLVTWVHPVRSGANQHAEGPADIVIVDLGPWYRGAGPCSASELAGRDRCRPPVILLSAYGSPARKVVDMRNATAIIAKPYDLEDLLAQVEHALSVCGCGERRRAA